jgi:predicted metal-dependent hydrolase
MADKQIQYTVSRRKVKYPRLEFKTGNLVIIAPFGFEIPPLIEKHRNWIFNKSEFINETIKEIKKEKLIERDRETFESLIKRLIKESKETLKVKPQKIYFRLMKTKWASCSKKRNITLNPLLKYLPEDLIRYVIFHEFCHLIIPRHDKKFWFLVSRKFDNPEQLERKLFGYWFLLWKFKDRGIN